jgi:hypothetical protein
MVLGFALLGWGSFWAVTQIGKRRANAYHDSLAGVYFLYSYPRKRGLADKLEMLGLLRTGRYRSIFWTAATEDVWFGATSEGYWTLKDGKITVVPEKVDGSPPDALARDLRKDGLKPERDQRFAALFRERVFIHEAGLPDRLMIQDLDLQQLLLPKPTRADPYFEKDGTR